jgi:hypothetical protein
VIVGTLLVLSLILMATTLISGINVPLLLVALFAVLVVGLIAGGLLSLRSRARQPAPPEGEEAPRRETWRMPPLALLGRPAWSKGRKFGMYTLRGYLVVAVILLIVKSVQLGTGG